MEAAKYGQAGVTQELARLGANIHCKTTSGEGAAMTAIQSNAGHGHIIAVIKALKVGARLSTVAHIVS